MLHVLIKNNVPATKAIKAVVLALRITANHLRLFDQRQIDDHRHRAMSTFCKEMSQLLGTLEKLSTSDQGRINTLLSPLLALRVFDTDVFVELLEALESAPFDRVRDQDRDAVRAALSYPRTLIFNDKRSYIDRIIPPDGTVRVDRSNLPPVRPIIIAWETIPDVIRLECERELTGLLRSKASIKPIDLLRQLANRMLPSISRVRGRPPNRRFGYLRELSEI